MSVNLGRNARLLLSAGAGMLVCTAAWSHHSFAMFDKSRTVALNGILKTVEWNNPHVWIWVTVPAKDGSLVDWALESGGPSQLNRMGIRRTMLNAGDKFSAEIYPMRDGRPGGSFKTFTLADGRTIDMGQSVKNFAAGGQPLSEAEGTQK